jgi:hypothetical protein
LATGAGILSPWRGMAVALEDPKVSKELRGDLMKRPMVIVALLVIGLGALWYYVSLQPPEGVEAMGEGHSLTMQWLALAISIVSLLSGLVGLIQKIIELRAARQRA